MSTISEGHCQFCFQTNNIVLILFVLFAKLYVLFTFLKKTMLFVLFTILLVFIHHWYLLSRFLLFFIGIIVLCIVFIVTLKWQQYYTTILTIYWTMEGGSKNFPKTMDRYGCNIVKMVKKDCHPTHIFSQYPIMKTISQKQ